MLNALKQGRFFDHPIHPLLVHLPVGLWVGSLVGDILYFSTHSPVYAHAALYTLAGGLIGGLLAAVFGLVEFFYLPRESRARTVAITHLVLNVIIIGLYVVNYLIRRYNTQAVDSVPVAGFVLSLVAVALLSYSGYLGGKLVYTYGVGSHPELRPIGKDHIGSDSRAPSDRRAA
jgi:uncharacterized membrane protein